MDEKDRKKYFLKIYKKACRKYGKSTRRLAADKWGASWRTLIVTIMSAQSRDETTIPIAEKLFKKYSTLEKLSKARVGDVIKIFRSLNYNRTKAKNVIGACKFIKDEFNGVLPEDIDELVRVPGVGRKTANLVLWEAHKIQGICVDTHVHRISNVLGIVQTKTPEQTEQELMKIVPRSLWGRVNRMFVLWGKEVPGKDKIRLLKHLEE